MNDELVKVIYEALEGDVSGSQADNAAKDVRAFLRVVVSHLNEISFRHHWKGMQDWCVYCQQAWPCPDKLDADRALAILRPNPMDEEIEWLPRYTKLMAEMASHDEGRDEKHGD